MSSPSFKPGRFSSLGVRLQALLLLAVILPLIFVGTVLVLFIQQYHQAGAARQFETVFQAAGDELIQDRAHLKASARLLAERDDIISVFNLLHRYATPATYRSLIFDPEKRTLAVALANQARAARLDQVAAYGMDGRLLAFFCSTVDSYGYLSYGPEGAAEVLLWNSEHGQWESGTLPVQLVAHRPAVTRLELFSARRIPDGYAREAQRIVERGYPDGRREPVGLLVASRFIGTGFSRRMAARTGAEFALLFADGLRIGGVAGVDLEMFGEVVPPLGEAAPLPVVRTSDWFLAVRQEGLSDGSAAWLVAGLPTAVVSADVRDMTALVLMVLVVAALVVVPIGAFAGRRAISKPVKQLARGVEAIQQGDYERQVPWQRRDEFGLLAHAVNGMAVAIRSREQALSASEAKYRTLVDNLPQRVFQKDREGRFVSCNTRFAADLGLTPEQVVGRRDEELFPPELVKQYRAADRRVMEQQQIEELEQRYVAGGQSLIVQMVKTPLFDSDGQISGVLGIFWDITERKRTEEKLRQSAVVFESTAEGVMITDTEGTILAVNKAFGEITGFVEEEVLGAKPSIRRSERQDAVFYQAMWRSLKKEGYWQGEIWNRRKSGEVYPEWMTISAVRDDAGRPTHYVAVFSDITAIKQSQEKLNHLAYHDPLTGLPNRLLLTDRLTHAIGRVRRSGKSLAVLFADLDRFKNINDTLGHPVGDELLQQVAERLRHSLREDDTVARLGGDEFVILLEESGSLKQLEQVASKLLNLFHAPFTVRGKALYIGCSIGISLYPDDGTEVATLIKNADAAMYRAKERGRNTFEFYKAEMTALAAERLELEAGLRQALELGEFCLVYQPQMDLAQGTVVGAEALVRWRHPVQGLIPPDKFIPLAEENGLIIQLGKWVLREACVQARHWSEQGLLQSVSVNLSGIQMQRGNIVATVREILDETGLAPAALELEVTESVIMEQPDQVIEILEDLRALGIRVAVDDFGTGYSSLAYLKRFPIDSLKIDRSFVRDIPADVNDTAITQAIIALARSLKLFVTAEGVESEAQQRFLLTESCQRAQGYFYSRPVSAATLEEWLRLASRKFG